MLKLVCSSTGYLFLTTIFFSLTSYLSFFNSGKENKGTLIRIRNFKSVYVASRTIDVWLPEGYNPSSKYTVLYMQDGQMLFDSTTTWNKQTWNIDGVADSLIHVGAIKPLIIVGIYNNSTERYKDYFPQKPFESLSPIERDTVVSQLIRSGRVKEPFFAASDRYLQFIVKELKPFIDTTFSVYSDPENTAIAGSSMGGLLAIYAWCEYPNVFGSAASLSTHWSGTIYTENNPMPECFFRYFHNSMPSDTLHRIYFDYGNQGLDSLYPSLQNQVDKLMQQSDYTPNRWLTRYFPGENHSENAWRKRVHIPLQFLFTPNENK